MYLTDELRVEEGKGRFRLVLTGFHQTQYPVLIFDLLVFGLELSVDFEAIIMLKFQIVELLLKEGVLL